MAFRKLSDVEAKGKRALVRVDFNVPMQDGEVSDDTRLKAALPTIKALSWKGAKVILLAHFDRPKGKVVPEMSLGFVAEPLSKLLEQPVASIRATALPMMLRGRSWRRRWVDASMEGLPR